MAAFTGWVLIAVLGALSFDNPDTAISRRFEIWLRPGSLPDIHRVRNGEGDIIVNEIGAHAGKGIAWVSAGFWGIKVFAAGVLLWAISIPTTTYLFLFWLPHRIAPVSRKEIALLPSQRRIVDDLINLAEGMHHEVSGRIVGLRGDHGTGKSFLLEGLRQRLESHEDIAVVPVNIWENQREIDLHFAVAKQVFSHPKVLERCVNIYPARLVLMPPLMGLTYLLPKGIRINLGASQADIADPNASVPMVWQDIFRRIVAAARQRGLTVVVVLEEIDRADPPIAQVAMTLARRALDLPGVLTLLPYVEAQMRTKVFNPLAVTTPDLRGTMESILHDRYPGRGPEAKAGEMPDELRNRFRATANALYLRPPSVVTPAQVELQRYWLYQDFSEKYLRTSKRLWGLAPEEAAAFLSMAAITSGPWRQLTNGVDRNILGRVVADEITRRMTEFRFGTDDAMRPSDAWPNLRAVESESAMLADLRRRHPSEGQQTQICHAEAAAVAVLAYLIAAIDHQLPKDGPVPWSASRAAWGRFATEIHDACANGLAVPPASSDGYDFGIWVADRIDPKASPLPIRIV